jgi:hypothetical protein
MWQCYSGHGHGDTGLIVLGERERERRLFVLGERERQLIVLSEREREPDYLANAML